MSGSRRRGALSATRAVRCASLALLSSPPPDRVRVLAVRPHPPFPLQQWPRRPRLRCAGQDAVPVGRLLPRPRQPTLGELQHQGRVDRRRGPPRREESRGAAHQGRGPQGLPLPRGGLRLCPPDERHRRVGAHGVGARRRGRRGALPVGRLRVWAHAAGSVLGARAHPHRRVAAHVRGVRQGPRAVR